MKRHAKNVPPLKHFMALAASRNVVETSNILFVRLFNCFDG